MPKTKPGECHDKRGVPIYPGDLLKSYHFTGWKRGKWGQRYYLYHVAVWREDEQTMEMVPTSYLEPSKRNQGGRCWLTQEHAKTVEVISGCGPGNVLDHTDRERVKVEKAEPVEA